MAGLSLVELLVVLAVLLVTAGIVVPLLSSVRLGSSQKTAEEIATEQTLLSVRRAIQGGPGQPGYSSDLGGGRLPRTLADLFVAPASLPESLRSFDPGVRLGWRGPYLQFSGALLDADGLFDPEDIYGTNQDPAVLDGWGRPIVLQFPIVAEPLRSENARLVSAGRNGELETPRSRVRPVEGDLDKASCGDDLLLFLRVADTRP
jgi:type II secretory pathway pseudopilin PulG